jgi:hypothetical protein
MRAGCMAIILAGVAALPANGTERPSAEELLDKFAAAQDQLKSFIAQYETTTTFLERSSTFTTYAAGEMRFDGRHVMDRRRYWGRLNPKLERLKEKPRYQSSLVDDQFEYRYNRDFQSAADAGSLSLRDSRVAAVESPRAASPLADHLSIGRDFYRRIDERLREAAVIRMHDKLEPAGREALLCYVLEAETPHGHYTLWLDPAHGYNLAQAVRQCRAGHLRPNPNSKATYGQRETMLGVVRGVRFERGEGLWVPTEFTNVIDETNPTGVRCRITSHFRVTRLTLNPDHAALKSFVPDDIADGASVTIDAGDTRARKQGTWQAGRVVGAGGNVLCISEAMPK